MLSKTFKIGTNDYSEHARDNGLSVVYTPITGLSAKYTLDGTLHDDILANKATYTIATNPVSPAVGQAILSDYRQAEVSLTVYDVGAGADVTAACKPAAVPVSIALVDQGDVTYWQLGDLTFTEK